MIAQRERCETALLEEICDAVVNAGQADEENAEEALAQLEAGTYGYCLDCHDRIPAARLESMTFAVRCVYCDRAR